ncbi:MAG: AAA family ATPase, partial [bacterium]|nr:AAA family ATPase [bacterium]
PIKISFEGVGSGSYENEASFIEAFLIQLKRVFHISGNSNLEKFIDTRPHMETIIKLNIWLSKLVEKIGKKTVLMIDEVDKSCNNQLFLDFLGMLRDKYLKHNEGEEITFHSVILAGVHDVKSLKIKLRPDDEAKYNSPWNIAVDYDVDLSLFPHEIESMLKEYAAEQKVTIDIPLFAEKLFYYTSGYPFLVSYLCKIIDEKILPPKKEKAWHPHDLEKAVQLALLKDSTNFDSLIKNLENNPGLYEFVFNIIIEGAAFSYNRRNPVIHLGTQYGILKEDRRKTRIHNRLYEQLIYDYMSSNMETSGHTVFKGPGDNYVKQDGSLDIEKVIRKFQKFMKEQYSKKDLSFIERNGRLLFLAFLKPIINGKGFDFKEVQVSEEKRLDVVITFGKEKFIVELKIWYGESYHREGIKQLCDYLERQNQRKGYLLIYDLRKEKGRMGSCEKIETGGKEIFAAWV